MREQLTSPFPGLRPFESADYPLFFGRERQISALLRQMEDHHFVAVVGSSGSGKSSLVRAGLLPVLAEGFLGDTKDWLTLVIRPGHDPHLRLAEKIVRHVPAGLAAPAQPLEIAALLGKSESGLIQVLNQLPGAAGRHVLVVVDQFEELFAFRRPNATRDEVTSRDDAAAFVRLLLRSAASPDARIWVVITMRSDFIGECDAFHSLPEKVSESQFLVPRLDRTQMEEAIRRPGEVQDAGFAPFTFEPGLVNRIINEAGDRPDQLPLMQHALMRTWRRAADRTQTSGSPVLLTSKDYERSGGIEHALSRHANEAWKNIKPDNRLFAITRRLFLLLCDVSADGKITRRRPRVVEIEAATGASLGEIRDIMQRFQDDDRNFLIQSPADQPLSSQSRVDISHEALLRQWSVFIAWQFEEQADVAELRGLKDRTEKYAKKEGDLLSSIDLSRVVQWQRQISPAECLRHVSEQEWQSVQAFIEASKREQSRKIRRKRLLAGGIVAFLIVLSIGAALLIKRAADQTELARAQTKIAREKTEEAGLLEDHARERDELATKAIAAAKSATAESERQQQRAKQAVEEAQDALTHSYVRTLRVNDSNLSLDEEVALWELASLPSENRSVREKILTSWADDDNLVGRATELNGILLRAAAGIDPKLHVIVDSHALVSAKQLLGRLEKLQERGQDLLYISSNLIPPLSDYALLSSQPHAAAISSRAVPLILVSSKNELRFIAWSDVKQQADELAAHLRNLPQPERAKYAILPLQHDFQMLETPRPAEMPERPMADNRPREYLETAIVLFEFLTPADAQFVSRQAMVAFWAHVAQTKSANRDLSFAREEFSERLIWFLRTLPEPEATAAAAKIAETFLSDSSFYVSRSRSGKLEAPDLFVRLRPFLATDDIKRILKVKAEPNAAANEPKSETRRLPLLAAIARQLDGAPTREIAAALSVELAGAMVDQMVAGLVDPTLQGDLALALSNLGEWMAPREYAGCILRLVQSLPAEDSNRLLYLLPPLAAKLDAEGAGQVAAALVPPRYRSTDVRAIAALARRMDAGKARLWVAPELDRSRQRLLDALAANPAMSSLEYSARDFSELARWGEPKESARLAQSAAQALLDELSKAEPESPSTSYDVARIAQIIAALVDVLEPGTRNTLAVSMAGKLLAASVEPYPLDRETLLALISDMQPADAARTVQSLARMSPDMLGSIVPQLLEATEPLAVDDRQRVLVPLALQIIQTLGGNTASDRSRTNFNGIGLARLVDKMPSAQRCRQLALLHLMQSRISTSKYRSYPLWSEDLEDLQGRLLARMSPQELAEILKWPICVGSSEQAVLAELGRQKGVEFTGDRKLEQLMEQAVRLGIENLAAPATKPDPAAAIEELLPLLPPSVPPRPAQ